jgi:hypothetical protein
MNNILILNWGEVRLLASIKAASLDSKYAISEPKLDALSNGVEMLSKFLEEMYYFSTLLSKRWNFHIKM